MAGNDLENFINNSMATLLTDQAINACVTNAKCVQFAANHFNINQPDITKQQLDPYLMNQRGTVKFKDFMDLIDLNQNGWQTAFARITAAANRSGLNHRLELLHENQVRLHELTIGQMQCRALTKTPPLYDQKKHISLSHFSNTEWKYFYLGQGIDRDYSKRFLAMAFSNNETLRDNIQELVEAHAADTLDQIIEAIKNEINLDSETDYQKQQLFTKWEFDMKISAERNWNKLYTLRKAAWPAEAANQHFDKSKEKFLRKLRVKSNSLHQTLFQWSLTQDFQNFNDNFSLAGKIREIELRFSSNSDDRTSRNSVPTHHQNADMEIDNLKKKIRSIVSKKKLGSFGKSTQSSTSKTASKTCDTCEKPFKPLRSYWKRCKDCQSKKKSMNNIEKQEEEEQESESDSLPELNNLEINEVSSNSDNILVYKIGVELQNFRNETSVLCNDSIYDNGANIFAMSKRELIRIDKQMGYETPLYNRNPKNNPVAQGDGSTMNGYLGERNFYITLKDSEGYSTPRQRVKFLIFDKLNHDVIIGRNAMKNILKVVEYPRHSKLLINPTARRLKQADLKYSEFPCKKSKLLEFEQKCIQTLRETFDNKAGKSGISHQDDWKEKIRYFTPDKSIAIQEGTEKLERGILLLEEDLESEELEIPSENLDLDGKILKTNKGEVKVRHDLPEKYCKELIEFFNSMPKRIFCEETMGSTPNYKAKIKLKEGKTLDDIPPVRFIPLSPNYKVEMRKLLNKMLVKKILRKTTKKANTCMFLVEKSSGQGYRLIADLKSLNKILEDYVTHLNPIQNVLQELAKFDTFSYVDYRDAYFSVPIDLDASDIDIVASVSGEISNYQFLKIPQGLKQSSGMFIDALSEIYREFAEWCYLYLDDGGIGATGDEEMMTRIKKYLLKTDENNLRIKLSKCAFFMHKINFLNFDVSKNKISMSKSHRESIERLEIPDSFDQKSRESIAGFISYFARFIPTAKYCRILRTGTVDECRIILKEAKKQLLNAEALEVVNFKDTLHIFVDASDDMAAAAIFQGNKKSELKLVTSWSQMIPENVKTRPIYAKELWCLSRCLSNKNWKYFLFGKHRKIVYCDNRCVVASANSRAPTLRNFFEVVRNTLGNIEFCWIEGKKNPVDALTRFSCFKNKEINAVMTRRKKALQDSISDAIDIPSVEKIERIHCHANHMKADPLIEVLLKLGHSKKLVAPLVKNVIENCTTCAALENAKKPRKQAPGITKTSSTVNDCIFIDHKKIKVKSRTSVVVDGNGFEAKDENWENEAILSIFEPLSRAVYFAPVKGYDAIDTKRALRQFFIQHGSVKDVVADNYNTFIGLKGWLKSEFNSELHHTSLYHPCSNLSEKAHSNYNQVLDRFEKHTSKYGYENWEDNLTKFCIAHNATNINGKHISYEILKNRDLKSIFPVEFNQTDREKETHDYQLTTKVSKVLKSRLKVTNTIFSHGQRVKIMIPDQPVKFGVIEDPNSTDTKYKTAVSIRFEKAPGQLTKGIKKINKNFVA